jgi:putative transcriptional regulator
MGLVVNRPSEYTLGDVLEQMGIEAADPTLRAQQVLAGGPVHPERGFVLHDGDRGWDSSLLIAQGLRLTTSRDILEAIARGDGPRRVTVVLGCAGWDAGQLEQELAENSWLTADSDAELLFALPLEARWQAAAGRIGVDLMRMPDYSGHA